MDQILDTITALYERISALLSDYLLLAAGGLGLVFILLLILLIARRRRAPFSGGDGDIEFLEVGPEPVIVYRRAAEQGENQKPPAEPEPQSEPTPELDQGQAEPEPEEDEQEDMPVTPDLDAPEPPVAEPILDPEPMPDAEPESQPEPEPVPAQPLPYLRSELANNTLKLFGEQGFHIEQIVYEGIYGGDFIAVRPGVRAYVQVKDWKKKLTENAVTEVSNYASNHNCNHAIIVTAAKFNRAAAKTAARLSVSLWNRRSLSKLRDKPIFPREEVAATGE